MTSPDAVAGGNFQCRVCSLSYLHLSGNQCLPSVDSVNMFAYVWLSESWYDFIVRIWLQPEVTHGWSDLYHWFSIISLKRWFGGLWSCHMEPHLEPSICTVRISAWGNLGGCFAVAHKPLSQLLIKDIEQGPTIWIYVNVLGRNLMPSANHCPV